MHGTKTNFVLCSSLCALCLCGKYSFAAPPQLSGTTPTGAQRGTTAVVSFTGARLDAPQEILCYSPGVAVAKLDAVGPTQVNATLVIAPDCRLGEHLVRVRTAGGLSDARTFWVGALPVVDEKEPNSEFARAQPVPLNSTVAGTIGSEDVDYFAVACKKGQRLAVEVEGMRLGRAFFDPHVSILDSKRFELAASDDAPGLGQDGGCAVVVPADGTYVVAVRESTYGAGSSYRLHVGTFPRPTAVVPAGGRPGEELEVRFLGDPLGEIRQKVKLPAAPDPAFRAHCRTPDGVHPGGFKLRVVDLPNVVETGNNSSVATAAPGPAGPAAFHGVIGRDGELDYFKFPATKGQPLDIQCYARRLGSPLDSVVTVMTDKGQYLGANDDTGGPDSYLRFVPPADGAYVIAVRDHLFKGGPDYFYRVEVAPPAAGTGTDLQRVDGNNVTNQERQAVTVPRGNRMAAVVLLTRADPAGVVKGPLVLTADRLPAGVTAAADPVEPGRSAAPVVFEASADAPLGGLLTPLRATPADPAVIMPSSTALPVNFNLGVNNTPFHQVVTDRVAVAVAAAIPFTVAVVEPKVPLVQSGSAGLRVVVTRAAGFKGAVTVSPVWAPPGVGMQTSATIPEGATETVLAINATANAAPKTWRTAVLATADDGKGPAWASSQMFALTVSKPFLTIELQRAMVEQGGTGVMVGKVAVATPFAGKAVVKLIGLPNKVTAPDLDVLAGTTELPFALTADKASPAGKHGNIFCQVLVPLNGEVVVHNLGGAELRVDAPLPPKPAAAKPAAPVAAKPAAAPAVAAKPPEPKRLTRLEQLRLDQEEKEKAGKGGKP